MRIIKIIFISVFLVIAGLYTLIFFIQPVTWRSYTRRESIKILTAAKTTNELSKAVGHLGLFMSLTNGGWIAIRYEDMHSIPICSSAVARDSGGDWFESKRHFCGSLPFWPRLKMQVDGEEEQRKLTPEWFTNRVSKADSDNGSFPSYREMLAIESAPDLESARHALQKIGFKEFHP